jgi:hypothetical protein
LRGLSGSGEPHDEQAGSVLCALRQLPLGLRGTPNRPWEGPRACGCGAPGDPCPVRNRVDTGTEPELPEDFVVDIRKIRGRWD